MQILLTLCPFCVVNTIFFDRSRSSDSVKKWGGSFKKILVWVCRYLLIIAIATVLCVFVLLLILV